MSSMVDIDHLKGWIGREQSATDVLTPQLVARFDVVCGTRSEHAEGAVAPLLIHLCLAPPAVSMEGLSEDGHPSRGDFLPPVPLPRRMWAGGQFTFEGNLRVGDTVTCHSRIADVSLKEGRSGTLCFVTVERTVHAGETRVLQERRDIVYREPAAAGDTRPAPAAPAPEGEHRSVVDPTPVLLFRYSALTFNAHRIHYDAPYVREVEAYPGLVVHGPLQATLLAHLAAEIAGRRPTRFSFRSLSPLFADASLVLSASKDGEGLRLWTSRPDGPIAMTAEASFD